MKGIVVQVLGKCMYTGYLGPFGKRLRGSGLGPHASPRDWQLPRTTTAPNQVSSILFGGIMLPNIE